MTRVSGATVAAHTHQRFPSGGSSQSEQPPANLRRRFAAHRATSPAAKRLRILAGGARTPGDAMNGMSAATAAPETST
jgi:hypothetical protein